MKDNQSGNLLEQETAQPIPAQPREGRPANLPAKFWDDERPHKNRRTD